MPNTISGFALFVFLAAGTAAAEDIPKHWVEPMEPFRIAGPIYYVGTKGLGVYLITTREGHILVSGAMPESARHIEESIEALGFKVDDVRLLLVAHAHVDHVGTLAYLKKQSGGAVVASKAEVPLLKSGGRTDYLFAKKLDFRFEGVTVERTVKDGETVSLGGAHLVAHKTAGHTAGCLTWETTVWEDGRTYRVVFADGLSVNPGTRLTKRPSYAGIARDFQRTFKTLEALDPDIFLAYHAEFFDLEGKRARMDAEGVGVWVDPEGYKRRVGAKQAAFEQALAAERK